MAWFEAPKNSTFSSPRVQVLLTLEDSDIKERMRYKIAAQEGFGLPGLRFYSAFPLKHQYNLHTGLATSLPLRVLLGAQEDSSVITETPLKRALRCATSSLKRGKI